jgi:FtsP/CotA-like multicopper oxidase with cupredoxin domain
MERRTFLQLAAATALTQLPGCGGGSGGNTNGGTVPIVNPPQASGTLPIPTLLAGTSFNLALQSGSMTFLAGKTTPTYGINGNFLGPALKVRNGDPITLNVTNNLAEVATLHWHGMHLPANMDGGPHQTIQPGAIWTASFTVKQKAGTNWFHPHTEGQTGRQVYMGLAGLLIVEDTDTDVLDLPKTWGVDDIPLIVQDRLFKADGSFDYLPTMQDQMNGMMGNTLLCNGTVNAVVDLPAKEVRFRLLNGSNARVYNLTFSDGRSFRQIATDTALQANPTNLLALKLSPGERAEIVVDCTLDMGKSLSLIDTLSGVAIVTANVNTAPASVTTLPAVLTTLPTLNPALAVRTRTFSLSMGMGGMGGGMGQFLINGLAMDSTRIDQTVPLNDIEIWEIINTMNVVHNFHVHGTHFEILDRNGSAANVAAYEKGHKDVVLINPFDTVRIIIQMTDYTTGASAPYMFHCHILEHEDGGMMGQFIVV